MFMRACEAETANFTNHELELAVVLQYILMSEQNNMWQPHWSSYVCLSLPKLDCRSLTFPDYQVMSTATPSLRMTYGYVCSSWLIIDNNLDFLC